MRKGLPLAKNIFDFGKKRGDTFLKGVTSVLFQGMKINAHGYAPLPSSFFVCAIRKKAPFVTISASGKTNEEMEWFEWFKWFEWFCPFGVYTY